MRSGDSSATRSTGGIAPRPNTAVTMPSTANAIAPMSAMVTQRGVIAPYSTGSTAARRPPSGGGTPSRFRERALLDDDAAPHQQNEREGRERAGDRRVRRERNRRQLPRDGDVV